MKILDTGGSEQYRVATATTCTAGGSVIDFIAMSELPEINLPPVQDGLVIVVSDFHRLSHPERPDLVTWDDHYQAYKVNNLAWIERFIVHDFSEFLEE